MCDQLRAYSHFPQMTDFKVNDPKDYLNDMRPELQDVVESLYE